jgi:hypothetical protein
VGDERDGFSSCNRNDDQNDEKQAKARGAAECARVVEDLGVEARSTLRARLGAPDVDYEVP